MPSSLFSKYILLSILFQGLFAVTSCGETMAPVNLQRIADPSMKESDVLALMKQLRTTLPTDDQAKLWVQIANSDKYSDARRRRAVLLLFERHVLNGMELSTVASLLENPTWLRQGNVRIIDALGGRIPISMVYGETVFVIIPEFSSSDKSAAVYLRVQGAPLLELDKQRVNPHERASLYSTVKGKAEELFCNALLGQESEAATLNITAVAASPSVLNDEDTRLFDRTSEIKILQRIADPNEKESDVLTLMEQQRAMPPNELQARFLVRIANSNEYSDARRRLAVLLLFERYVHSGMELRGAAHYLTSSAVLQKDYDRHERNGMELSKLIKLLGNPTWLKKNNVHIVNELGGRIPIEIVPGETVFVIIPEFSSLDKSTGIYLRVQNSPSVESFCDALSDIESKAAALKITAIAASRSIP